MALEPTEQERRTIKVRYLYRSDTETILVDSIREAIEEIKSDSDRRSPDCSKIILEGEVVYTSDRNGKIEDWEAEFDRAMRSLSVTESAYDCPYDTLGCVSDDLCIECQIDQAIDEMS